VGYTSIGLREIGVFQLWEIKTGQELAHVQVAPNEITGLAIGPSNDLLTTCWIAAQKVKLFDVKELCASGAQGLQYGRDQGDSFPKPLAEFEIGATDADSRCRIAYSNDGKKLATLGKRGIRIASAVTGEEIAVLDGLRPGRKTRRQSDRKEDASDGCLTAFSFAPDGQSLAVGDSLGTVTVWSIAAGSLLASMNNRSGETHDLAFSAEGDTLAAAYHDGSVRLWDTATGRLKSTLSGHPGPVRSLAFSVDGKTLSVAAPDSSMVRLWHLATEQVLFTENVPSGFVEFAKDGTCLVSVGTDGTIQVFHTRRAATDSQPNQ
jgi:WD40 repeat protein